MVEIVVLELRSAHLSWRSRIGPFERVEAIDKIRAWVRKRVAPLVPGPNPRATARTSGQVASYFDCIGVAKEVKISGARISSDHPISGEGRALGVLPLRLVNDAVMPGIARLRTSR